MPSEDRAIIPVYCQHCGAIFASRAFAIVNVRGLTLEGNRETCLNCGKLANIVDGVFDATEGLLKLISGPQFTKDVLSTFASLIEQAKQGKISEEELANRAEALSPELGTAVKGLRSKGLRSFPVLLVLLYALNQCKMEIRLDAKLDVNDLLRQTIEWVAPEPAAKGSTDSQRSGNKEAPASGAQEKHEHVVDDWNTRVIHFDPPQREN